MKTKFLIIAATLATLIVSCDGSQMPWVSREDYNAAKTEAEETKTRLDSIQTCYAKQTENMSMILSEIASLSRRTSTLSLSSGEKPASEINIAMNDINAVRARIDELEKDADKVRKLDKDLAISRQTIDQLRETVASQEKQIKSLREQIASQGKTIETQQSTIALQKDTISIQNKKLRQQTEQLEKTVWKQVELIYDAGNEFCRIADEGDFKITGRKNKQNVKEYRRLIYEEALGLYEVAAQEGHKAAKDSVKTTKDKIFRLLNQK